jgi:hemerythrin-like domain-containing protein
MADVVAPPRPDTNEMVRVHQVFREAFALAPQLIGAVATDDVDQVGRIATYYESVLLFLHVHHEGEDEILWPKLLERCAGDAAVVNLASDQHKGVLGDLAKAEESLAAWREQPGTDRGAELAAALATLGANLVVHLDNEEKTILPLVEEHLTVDEWHELPAHGMRTGGQRAPQLMWLVIGLIREQMTDAQRAGMDAGMPPPVREFWVNQGESMFLDFIGKLRA